MMDVKTVHEKYRYSVFWSEDDQEYVATCTEFPSLSWLETDSEAALRGIRALVKDVIEDMQQNGEVIPEPLACKSYSGQFMVRTTADVHRRLAMEAAEQNISLNRLVNSRLVA